MRGQGVGHWRLPQDVRGPRVLAPERRGDLLLGAADWRGAQAQEPSRRFPHGLVPLKCVTECATDRVATPGQTTGSFMAAVGALRCLKPRHACVQVKELRDMCYKPKACDLPGAMEKKIEFHSTCDYGGNNQDLILGNYERLW